MDGLKNLITAVVSWALKYCVAVFKKQARTELQQEEQDHANKINLQKALEEKKIRAYYQAKRDALPPDAPK